ncbi:hypothetical protein [Mycetocola reblochoni]|uniref:Uncharacterized protein n=1 Tax=Mycetocola reblochoni REB411 TaxID=1255698 RepID=A0A1R4J4L8_9MICO|nr:hypothetical protein [Mycetocola reblochoni]SJN26959.1 hypothetical protein FM119_05320 [Mycetocola reblochoni REB411]
MTDPRDPVQPDEQPPASAVDPTEGAPSDATSTAPDGDGTATRRRRWVIPVVLLAAAVVAGLVTFALLRPVAPTAPVATDASATETSAPTATPSSTPSPTQEQPSASPTTAAPVSYPTECRSIYTPGYWQNIDDVVLNDPGTAETPILREEPVEAFRTSLDGFDCRWGGPTEGGVFNGVRYVDEAQAAEAVDLLTANGATCSEAHGGTLCSLVLLSPTDEPDDDPNTWDTWWVEEQSLIRDGIWIATWASGSEGTIDDSTSHVYDAFWPQG